MCGRLFHLICLVLVCALASTTYGVVIGDFENEMDGWAVVTGDAAVTSTYSTTGVTLNEHSLRLVVPDGGYILCLTYNIPGQDMTDAFRKAQKISVDVTRLAAEWTPESGDRHGGLHMVVNAGGDGWDFWGDVGYEGWWDPEWVGDNTQTVTWDYSEWLPQIQWDNIWWLELFLISNYDDYTTGGVYYLDNIQLWGNIAAYDPQPPDGATDVKREPTLSWTPGANAVSHTIYLGTNFDDVNDVNIANLASYPNVTAASVDVNSYEPGILEFTTAYYWRIDEVNVPDIVKGEVWRFTTGNYVTVDDFEPYGDGIDPGPPPPPGNRIWYTWRDGLGWETPSPGWEGNGTGSTVDRVASPVHGDSQSMALGYDNGGSDDKALYSETERTFDPAQDWTAEGVRSLTLWFYGDPNNDANDTEQMYVKVNGAKVPYDGDMSDVQQAEWHEWRIDLGLFGVDLTSITKLAVGFGDEANTATPSGSGKVYIDDIWLYRPRCLLGERSVDFAKADYAPAGYVSGDCVIDYMELEITANEWLGTGYEITPVNPGTTNLLARYAFDGNSNDSVGGHHGTASGAPSYAAGKVGQAIILDGVDDFVTVGAVGISGAAPRTIAGWVKANTTDIPNWTNIFGFTSLTGSSDLSFDMNRRDYSAYCIHVYGWERDIMDVDLDWHHLAATYDGTTITWYGDGRLVNSEDRALSTEDNVQMGKRAHNDNHFPGWVDEVYIFARALSAPEIGWLAGYTLPFSEPFDLHQDDTVNFKDFAVLADMWLDAHMWP